MSSVEVKLNYQDLEKLMKNDNGEINLEISQSIANSFAKKYLKGMITDKLIEQAESFVKTYDFKDELKKLQKNLENGILSQLGFKVYNNSFMFSSFDIDKPLMKKIIEELNLNINIQIHQMILDKINNEEFLNKLKEYIDESLLKTVDKLITSKVKEKIDKALEIIKS